MFHIYVFCFFLIALVYYYTYFDSQFKNIYTSIYVPINVGLQIWCLNRLMYFQITERMSLDIVSKVISNNAVIAMQKYRGDVQLNKFKFKLFCLLFFIFIKVFIYH